MLLAPFMSMPAFCRVLFTCSCFAGSTCQSATLMHTHLTGNHKHSRAVAVPWLVARARLWFPTACLRSLVCRRAFSSHVCVCSDVIAVVRVMSESTGSRARAPPPVRRTLILRVALPFLQAQRSNTRHPLGDPFSASLRVVNGRGGGVLLALACAPRRGPRREKRLPGAEGPPEGNVNVTSRRSACAG